MDLGLSTILGSVATGIGTFFGQNETNRVNQQIASQNIAFQERENEITRQREDNAVQRAAADMQAAGLSKTLAAGNPASAAALNAPQNNYQHQSPIGKAVEKMNLVNSYLSAKQTEAQIKSANSEAAYKDALTAGQEINNQTLADKNLAEIAYRTAQTETSKALMKQYEAYIRLANIEGDYKAEYLKEQINNLVADTKYKEMNRSKASHEIFEIVARTNKIGKESEMLVYDMIQRSLQIRTMQHDLSYARQHNLPVGNVGGSILGVSPSGVESVLNGFFGIHPEDFRFARNAYGQTVSYSPYFDDEEIWDLINST